MRGSEQRGFGRNLPFHFAHYCSCEVIVILAVLMFVGGLSITAQAAAKNFAQQLVETTLAKHSCNRPERFPFLIWNEGFYGIAFPDADLVFVYSRVI